MKRPVFRPVSFWQAALMVLPDNAFFDLVRSVLGNIKTPFNKQRLLDDLSAFLARPEIQETIAALLDDADRRVIAAIALLEEPSPGELEHFFSGDFSFAALHSLLLNLEERLIIYRFREEDLSRIALNPKLESALAPAAAASSSLFPSVPSSAVPAPAAKQPPAISLDNRLFAALFAFFLSGERLFRLDETVAPPASGIIAPRKKTLDDGKRLFPELDLESAAGGIAALGLLVQDGERFRADVERLTAFASLGGEDRAAYFTAGMALYLRDAKGGENARGLPPGFAGRGLVWETARLVRALTDSLRGFAGEDPASRAYPRTTLIKLAEILRGNEKPAWNSAGEIPGTSLILTAMEKTGLLSGGPAAYRFMSPHDGAEPSGPVIAFDSPFSFVLYPEVPFSGALELALFCDLEESGTAPRFTLSRESSARGFNRGRNAADMWKLLDRLSGGRAGENLKYNIEDWERRYREVALYEGVVVTLSGERAYLAERGPLARMLLRTLVPAEEERPGVYLLDASDREAAAAALKDAGVDIFAVQEVSPSRTGGGSFHRLGGTGAGGAKELPEFARTGTPGAQDAGAAQSAAASRIMDEFRAALDGMKLDRQDKETLRDRIERRMIVSAAQLAPSSFRFEKREARALDYAGKTLIAKQAIASGSFLEISWPGNASTIAVKPEGLEKKGSETALVFRPRENAAEPLRVPLGKISLMRLIKQSIFGE